MLATSTEIVICQVCKWPLREHEASRACTACGTSFHEECWEYVGGCAVFGCSEMYETKKADAGDVLYWGVSEKRCPMCAEMIPMGDLACPYCHTAFDDLRPVTREDLIRAPESPPPTPLRRTAVLMLVLAVLGVTSPLVIVFGGIWYLARRRQIAEESATTRAIALVALAVAVLYAVLAGLGALAFRLGSANGGVQ